MSWDPSHNMLRERPKEHEQATTPAAPRRRMTDEEKQADKMFKKATRHRFSRLRVVRPANGFKVKNFIVHARRYGVDRDEAMKLVEKKLSEKERKEQCLI